MSHAEKPTETGAQGARRVDRPGAATDLEALRPRPTNWDLFPPAALLASLPDVIFLGTWVRREPGHSPLRAIVSIDLMAGEWLHISVSRRTRMPTWADLCVARDELGYGERVFVQVVPPARAWLNLVENCLHLLSRIDGDTIPRAMWDQVGCDGKYYRQPAPLR